MVTPCQIQFFGGGGEQGCVLREKWYRTKSVVFAAQSARGVKSEEMEGHPFACAYLELIRVDGGARGR